jgi:serine/threonine-protein kinase
MLVLSVEPDSLLARAGLRAGDKVVAIDSRPIRGTRDWGAVLANLEVDRVQRWKILRNEESIKLEIKPEQATWRNRLRAGYISYSALALCSFAVGLLIAFRRPRDPAARIGAWFIGTAAIAFGLPNGWAVVWRQAPLVVQALFWIPTVSRFVLVAIFLSLLMMFPRRLTRARWPWLLIWVPVLATLPWRVPQFFSVIYSPGEAFGIPSWVHQAALLRTMLYLAAGIGILLVTYRRMLVPDEKRRVRVLLTGTAISLAAAMAVVWKMNVEGFGQTSVLWIALIHPLTLAAPLAFAYAIVRHRVFDIRVIVRQGLQYAFARGAVLGLVPAMGAILVLDLAVNSQQPLAQILQARGWVYFAISAVAIALYWQRSQWLEAIDRRFFREQYDAQRLLRDIVQEIRTADSLENASQAVASRIEAALHPEFVSILVREPDEAVFRPLTSLPHEQPLLSRLADSKLVALASVLGKPLEILLGDSGWLEQRLPWEEIDLVRRARIDLLIPITTTPGEKQALLVLGIRRSEEPYTPKDQELLEAIAASLALLLEKPVVVEEHPAPPVRIESAQSTAGEPVSLQSVPGSPYEPMAGRVFSHYQVLQPLGKGGMGEIFLAEDTSLDRRVALKFLPELLQEDEIARKRFLREAKSAAALDHPFICKIYEAGQTELGHAFIAMEYVEGQTLKERLEEGPLSLQETIQISNEIAEALEMAHEKGIVHRDLKPANIMLTPQGHAKVMDFGLAKRIVADEGIEQDLSSGLTREGSTLGTPAYMSPEQVRAQKVDHRTDLFSFGIVLYEMLTGVHPFRRSQPVETMGAILHEEPRPLAAYLPRCSDLLQDTVKGMLAKNPDARMQTIAEVANRLTELSFRTEEFRLTAFLCSRLGKRLTLALAAVIAISIIGWWALVRDTADTGSPAVSSIAVLPLDNLSGDPENDPVAEGIHDALITDLAGLGLKRVIARSTVMRFKGSEKPPQEIARELNVTRLITGTVLRSGDRVRVTVQLINPATQAQEWAHNLEHDLRDILSLQNEIVGAVIQELKFQLTPQEEARLASAPPVNPEAHMAYLKGRSFLNKLTPEGIEKGLEYLREAIEKDPTNPLPYAGLALGYCLIGHGPSPPPDTFARAKAAALKAEELGGTLAETEAAFGAIYLYSDWDWAAAEKAFRNALELNPSLPDAHRNYSWYLFVVGERDQALAEMQRAIEVDPLAPLWNSDLGWQHWIEGRPQEALEGARKALELDPNYDQAIWLQGLVYSSQGMHEEAIEAHQRLAAQYRRWKWPLVRTYVVAGRVDEARKLLAEYLEGDPKPTGGWDGWFLVGIYAALGEKDEAFRWLEETYKERNSLLPWLHVVPHYASLQDDPRFLQMMQRLNIPPDAIVRSVNQTQ